nr:spermatogenesis associated 6-like protein isoform X3 [Castor canadensis]
MKTAKSFPGIAPKLEFSTRTAIRECVFLHGNRFLEERYKPRRPLSTSHRQISPLNNIKKKPKKNLDGLPKGLQSRAPSPYSTRRFFLGQPTQMNLGNTFKFSGERKPPFVVRHVDSAKPFGENNLEDHLWKSRRKSKFSDFTFPMRRAASLDSLAGNIKVIKEPDEWIVLRRESPSPLDSSRFHPSSQSTWKKIHERICNLLTSHRAQQQPKDDSVFKVNDVFGDPSYPLKKYPSHEQRHF